MQDNILRFHITAALLLQGIKSFTVYSAVKQMFFLPVPGKLSICRE